MLAVGFLLASASVAEAQAQPGDTLQVDQQAVDDVPLVGALRALMNAEGVPLVYASELVEGKRAHCSRPRGPARRLLRCMLEGTGLQARRLPSGTFVLEAVGSGKRADASAVVQGRVVDRRTGAPVPFASVALVGTFVGTAADAEGRFYLRIPPEQARGKVRVRVGAVAYVERRRTVAVQPGAVASWEAALRPKQVQLGSVTVEAERFHAAADADPSRYRLRPESAKNAPALAEPDVVRTLALLPGVTQANDLKAGLSVRGGSADQNQYLLDGVEVHNPSHLLGITGAFNLWALEHAEVHIGDFPVRYGGRLSSVIALETREVPADSTFLKANISLLSASGAYARRFGKTRVAVAARRTYADPVLAALAVNLNYNFYDLNLKVARPLGNGFTAEAFAYTNRDALSGNADNPTDGGVAEDDHLAWGNYLAALRLKHESGPWRHRLTAAYTRNFTNATVGSADSAFIDDALSDATLRYRGAGTFRKSRLTFGTFLKHIATDYAWSGQGDPFEGDLKWPGMPDAFVQSRSAPLYGAYLSGETYFTPRLAVQGGLRYASRGGVSGGVWQPRVKLSFEASDDWTVSVGAGRYAQYVAEGSEGKEFTLQQPTFLLDQPQTAWTTSAGAAWTPSDRYRVSAEVYARRLDRFTRLGGEAVPPEKVGFRSREDGGAPYPGFVHGTGDVLGLDLFLQKTRGWITGQLAYSYTRARLAFEGKRFPPRWSVPHSLQGLIGLRVGRWRFGVAGTLRSGLPYTPVRGRFFGPRPDDPEGVSEQFLLGEPNSARFPYYGRVDLSLRRTYTAQHFDWTLYLQALNLFNRGNPQRLDDAARYYRYGLHGSGVSAGGVPAGMMRSLPVIPSVGVEFTF